MFTHEQFIALSFDQKKEVMEFMAKFHAKKAKTTAEMDRIPKNGFNSHHQYHYARESDVKDKIRPIMYENKLSFSIDLLERAESPAGKWTKTDVKMLFKITDTETGYFETFIHDGSALDNGDKGIYKAYSNTIKYALMDYFLIPTGDDVEQVSPTVEQPQQNPERQTRQGTTRTSNSGQQTNEKPVWKRIMDAEDELAQVAGTEKSQIRIELKGLFGQLPKYKEIEQQKAEIVLKQLLAWIEKYKNPID